MTIYVLNIAHDYEGQDTLGAFLDKDKAIAAMRRFAKVRGCDELIEFDGEWVENPGASTQYLIHEFETDAD